MWLAKYGQAFTFHAPMITAGAVDHAGSGDWTPASGDVKVSKDEGTQANITTLPSFSNGEWKWTLSATEMQAAKVYIKVVDSATKAVEDQAFLICTYGNASAHILADLDEVGVGQRLAVDVEGWNGVALATTNPLPNAAADAAGGLPISDAGGLDLDAILADTNELQGDWTNGGRLDLILDELTTQGDTNEGKIDTIDGIVDLILVDTGTTLPASLTAIETDTQDIQSRIPAALVGGRIDATVDGTGMEAGATAAIATAVLTTQMTESYNADGTAPTLAQATFVTMQGVTEFAISGTTKTVKKLDGSTTAYTETLDDASTPTSITRAT